MRPYQVGPVCASSLPQFSHDHFQWNHCIPGAPPNAATVAPSLTIMHPPVLDIRADCAQLSVTLSPHPVLSLSRDDKILLSGTISIPPPKKISVTHQNHLHILQLDATTFSIAQLPTSFQVHITTESPEPLTANFALGDQSWFGLGHLMHQHWPLNAGALPLGPLYPFDNGPTGVCTLVEPTFISTSGAVVIAEQDSRCLHVGLNAPPIPEIPLVWGTGVANFDRKILPAVDTGDGNGVLALQSRSEYDWPHVIHPWLVPDPAAVDEPRVVDAPTRPHLKFCLAATENVRTACNHVLETVKQFGSRPSPPTDMMRYPIWSTWARYKDAVTQQDVLEFANDIVNRDLPRSVMGIDDRWSVKYGDLEFDKLKFPDPKNMIDQLHSLGFVVTLWVTPFANIDSTAVTCHPDYFVRTRDGEVGEFEWWQPTCVAALDVTNPDAVDWFVSGLRRLCDKYGLDGFKFDAGEPSFLPAESTLQDTMASPAEYTRTWLHEVASKFPVSEVRSGVRGCQSATPMFRLFDRFSTWGAQNGLLSVLAGLLTSGILGYPFCIPDYIAGNSYGDETPDAELLIRWAQASAAMPAMQFSIPPWDMGTECQLLCEKALVWREKLFWPRIEQCIKAAEEDYIPICRPMWWIEPNGGVEKVYDQFMIGDDLVVAPVVVPDQRERRVYLPAGSWVRAEVENGVNERKFSGPTWLTRVSAQIDEMPTFVRVAV